MAASLIGGSVLSAFLQVLFDRMASREVLDFFKGRKLNDGLLEKLRTTIESVNGVLDDAEEESILSQLSATKVGTYISKTKGPEFLPSSNSFKKGMNPKLEEILDRLEYLVKQKDTLNLKEGVQGKPWSLKTATTSLVDESGIYGREDDKEAIMLRVLSDDPNGNDLGVIPIVGMGGMGKTTLAQLVYNDRRVCEWFDLKAWVCVSEEFDVFRVTKDIFEELTWKTCDIMTLNRLQLELKERVMGKKFFLVLDDVWNDKYEDWDILWRPLRYGAKGSKVVITTRNRRVASIMQTVPTHHLKQLTDDDCWCLFAKHAFDDGDSGIHSNLKEIGRGIVGKCKGLPLTAKTLGALLRPKEMLRNGRRYGRVICGICQMTAFFQL
ncbi:hypothetical protein GH714_017339 [Hevea brasiliensis]|uniref:NB-ARC domain-containing protein n=1 Tax=Hevea brasiliensis TaxID=3981 RepID=A0A6A6N8M8_HEVBR|nr:hypothetical protein GH714_017339 [Hevea brasiliensis]